MYVGVSCNGEVIWNQQSPMEEAPVEFNGAFYGVPFHITSKALRTGDISEIVIDGRDRSVNVRGINIVVYDSENFRVIDSIGCDFCRVNYKLVRYGEK